MLRTRCGAVRSLRRVGIGVEVAANVYGLSCDRERLAGAPRPNPFLRGDAEVIQRAAAGLERFRQDHGLDDDAAVRSWAEGAAPFERHHDDEPYVGSIKGIGIATFAYLRMRCGADAIKPDVRVREALGSLLFPLGDGSDLALLCVAGAAAEELGVTRLQLDQLLWW